MRSKRKGFKDVADGKKRRLKRILNDNPVLTSPAVFNKAFSQILNEIKDAEFFGHWAMAYTLILWRTSGREERRSMIVQYNSKS